jgi:hypothetical protein
MARPRTGGRASSRATAGWAMGSGPSGERSRRRPRGALGTCYDGGLGGDGRRRRVSLWTVTQRRCRRRPPTLTERSCCRSLIDLAPCRDPLGQRRWWRVSSSSEGPDRAAGAAAVAAATAGGTSDGGGRRRRRGVLERWAELASAERRRPDASQRNCRGGLRARHAQVGELAWRVRWGAE